MIDKMMNVFHALRRMVGLAALFVLGLPALYGGGHGVVSAFSTTSTTLKERTALIQVLPRSGFICQGPTEVRDVCEACETLENAAKIDYTTTTAAIDGTWRLRFTSASPYGLLRSLPDTIDIQTLLPEPIRKFFIDDSVLLPSSIEQRIDNLNGRIVNCLELSPWPKSNDNNDNPIENVLQQALSAIPGPLSDTLEALRESKICLEFDHSFSRSQNVGSKDTVNVNLEIIRRNLVSSGSNNKALLPEFIPKESTYNILPFQLTGSFETTYVDNTLRIARGTSFPFNDEILVFERVGGAGATALEDEVVDSGASSKADIPDECELSYEDDGETPVVLCDDEDLAGFMPSD